MKLHFFQREQHILRPRDVVWAFFTDITNLEAITPEDNKFRTVYQSTPKIQLNTLIEHELDIFPFITCRWLSEIRLFKEFEEFMDEQRFGPFLFWQHRHRFLDDPAGGTIMIDEVHYGMRFGLFGEIANDLFVKNQLSHLFDHRQRGINSHFQ